MYVYQMGSVNTKTNQGLPSRELCAESVEKFLKMSDQYYSVTLITVDANGQLLLLPEYHVSQGSIYL